MPILIDPSSPDHHLFAREGSAAAGPAKDTSFTDCINIGLINNMPDSALIPTERQLFDLLSAAAGKLPIRLHLYAMDTTPRTDWGRDYVRRFYRGINDLLDVSLDGFIVTGAEPKTENLIEEPYCETFVRVIDWAKENTVSSVCSCLAVHGAVLHFDGVDRCPLPNKCIGVFNQTRTTLHPLMLGVPERLKFPHSRWNEVREADLVQSGYKVLTKSDAAGVDCFVKQHKKSLFVCFQGHPEYEAQTLLGEYRRDIGRFLRGENDSYPSMPQSYFDGPTEKQLGVFEREARLTRRPELLASFPVDRLAQDLRNTWHLAARRIYRNWLLYLSSQRVRRSKPLTVGSLA